MQGETKTSMKWLKLRNDWKWFYSMICSTEVTHERRLIIAHRCTYFNVFEVKAKPLVQPKYWARGGGLTIHTVFAAQLFDQANKRPLMDRRCSLLAITLSPFLITFSLLPSSAPLSLLPLHPISLSLISPVFLSLPSLICSSSVVHLSRLTTTETLNPCTASIPFLQYLTWMFYYYSI